MSAKDASQKIKELEKNNLNLRRMLDLVSSESTNSTGIMNTSNKRLLVNRSAAKNSLGPPV